MHRRQDSCFEGEEEEHNSSFGSSGSSSQNVTVISALDKPASLTQTAVKDYIMAHGGKCKYSELFNHFRDLLVDASSDDKFQEFVSNLATRKLESVNNTQVEWIIIKKKARGEYDVSSSPTSNSSFFAHTIQRTKQNFNKLSHAIHSMKLDKDPAVMVNNPKKHSMTILNPNYVKNFSKLIKSRAHQNASSNNINNLLNVSSMSATNLTNVGDISDASIDCTKVSNDDTILAVKSRKSSSLGILDPNLNKTLIKDEDSNEIGIKSVKDQARKLNRLSTEGQLNDITKNKQFLKPPGISQPKPPEKPEKVEIENFDFSDPKAHEKEWMLVCSRGDYMEMARLLSKQPYLAQKRDPFTTAAHWACKTGNVEILKLLASVLENDTKTNPKSIRINHLINSKSGYTCLHIAYMFKHSKIVPYLSSYGAEGLTDYSGKIGIEYSNSSIDQFLYTNPTPKNYIKLSELKSITSNAKPASTDTTLIKRSSSAVLAKKEKDIKENMGFSSMKITNNKPSRPSITNPLVSPIKRRESKVASVAPPIAPPPVVPPVPAPVCVMPPPPTNIVVRVKPTTRRAQNVHSKKNLDSECKENIFI